MTPSRPSSNAIRASLDGMRVWDDDRTDVRERFITPTIGGGRTVGVLATPSGRMRTTGWVVCHSFGMEQVNLQTHEVPAARALAASGFPVLRYHGQGYGDSESRPTNVGLRSHVRDAIDAAEVLVAETGVRSLAFLGARAGGAVAALTAVQLGAEGLVLWEPVVHGLPYVRALLRLAVMLQLMHGERTDEGARDPEAVMRERGFLDVQGFPLTAETYDELASLDLAERIGEPRAHAGPAGLARRRRAGRPPGTARLLAAPGKRRVARRDHRCEGERVRRASLQADGRRREDRHPGRDRHSARGEHRPMGDGARPNS